MSASIDPAVEKFIEYAKKNGCPDEVAAKIPAMFQAMVDYTLFGMGPTPEEVNPGFYQNAPAKILPFKKED